MENSSVSVKIQNRFSKYAENYYIFIDTCSLLDEGSDKFWPKMIPELKKHNKKIIVPYRCYEELEKHSNNKQKPDLAARASSVLRGVKQLYKAGYIDIRGESRDNFADNVFVTVFNQFRLQYDLVLITQDKDLTKDILQLNKFGSARGHRIRVRRLDEGGYMVNPKGDKGKTHSTYNEKNDCKVPENEKFRKCTKITSVPATPIRITDIPFENQPVYIKDNRQITLLDKISEGGEGCIYDTNTPYVAKIYKNNKITSRKKAKIELMLSKKLECPGICYPIAALYNKNKQFVGYLMNKAEGSELMKSVFIPPLFKKKFPNWKKRDTVELCITILKKIKYLHDRNIILGDINPSNILVSSPTEVCFVDTDSYQIEDFPCPVGTINFTAPEIQRRDFKTFLRTIEQERFAVATLMFMLMVPGKPPYSQQGGGDPIDNIIRMDFSYPFSDNSNKKTPDGPWRFVWSHLTYDLKEAFYNSFRKDGKNSKPENRLSVEDWLGLFSYYLKLLDDGKMGQQDKNSEELFPSSYKKSSKLSYVKCQLCAKEQPDYLCTNGICKKCLNLGDPYRCARCGKEILYTNYHKYIKRVKRFEVCQDCFEYGNQVSKILYCVQCNNRFEITNSQEDFFRNKGMELPKRCPECRGKNRNNGNNNHGNQGAYSGSVSGSMCYITTAVMEFYGKGDNCYELNVLREFRDKWLAKQPDGMELINEYYLQAPLLVSNLKQDVENYKDVCSLLCSKYLEPCIRMIEQGEYEKCKQKYIEMFNYVKKHYDSN